MEEALILDIEVIEMEHKKELEALKEALKLLLKGKTPEEAAEETGLSLERIEEIMKS